MKRINVVVNSHEMNNWDILDQGMTLQGEKDNYQVFFHRDPRLSVKDGVACFNFDLAITGGEMAVDGMKIQDVLPPSRVSVVKRYNKLEQQLRLQAGAVVIQQWHEGAFFPGLDKWLPLEHYHQPQSSGWSHLINPIGKVVIKPRDGARGIGQFLVDTKQIPIASVVDALDRFVQDKIDGEELFKRLGQFGKVSYSTAGENTPGEGLQCLRSQNYCIQSFIPGIVAEYRLLTGSDGKVVYCQKRDIRDDTSDFPQATGSSSNSNKGDDVVDIATVLDRDDLAGLNELASLMIGPVSSIDLFITKEGKWGILEYCNQFAMKGVKMDVAYKLHADHLLNLIEKAGL